MAVVRAVVQDAGQPHWHQAQAAYLNCKRAKPVGEERLLQCRQERFILSEVLSDSDHCMLHPSHHSRNISSLLLHFKVLYSD